MEPKAAAIDRVHCIKRPSTEGQTLIKPVIINAC
jgi:hypothetical protein